MKTSSPKLERLALAFHAVLFQLEILAEEIEIQDLLDDTTKSSIHLVLNIFESMAKHIEATRKEKVVEATPTSLPNVTVN